MANNEFGGRITWLGHAAFLIESPRGARIAIDPFTRNNPKFPVGFDYGKLDVIAATHGPWPLRSLRRRRNRAAKKTGATVIGVFELALHAEAEGIEKTSGMNKGGSQTVKGVEFRMVTADHSSGATDGKKTS